MFVGSVCLSDVIVNEVFENYLLNIFFTIVSAPTSVSPPPGRVPGLSPLGRSCSCCSACAEKTNCVSNFQKGRNLKNDFYHYSHLIPPGCLAAALLFLFNSEQKGLLVAHIFQFFVFVFLFSAFFTFLHLVDLLIRVVSITIFSFVLFLVTLINCSGWSMN